MTEEQPSKLNPEPNSSKFIAQFVVEAFESRFPELLNNSARYLLFHFIADSTEDLQTENKKLKNVLTRVLTHAIVYRGVPEFDHVIDVVENSRVLGE